MTSMPTRSTASIFAAFSLLFMAFSALAQEAPTPTEQTLFIFQSGRHYLAMSSDEWSHEGRVSPPCSDCETYFMQFRAFKPNEFIPLRTGQQLTYQADTISHTTTLHESDAVLGDQVSILLCARGQTPNQKECWWPLNMIVRNVDNTPVYWKQAFPRGSAGDLLEVQRRFGAQTVIAAGEKDAILAQLQDNARAVARQNAGIAQRAAEDAAAQKAARLAKQEAMETDAVAMRKTIRIGTTTNCGQVFDVRLPMVGVQTQAGMQFIQVDRLYGPNAGCSIVNGVYQGPML